MYFNGFFGQKEQLPTVVVAPELCDGCCLKWMTWNQLQLTLDVSRCLRLVLLRQQRAVDSTKRQQNVTVYDDITDLF